MNKVLSQKGLFEKAFIEIKKDVTKDDRINCATKLNLSKVTVDRYVNSHVYDCSTADKIIKYLKKRIEKRTNSLTK